MTLRNIAITCGLSARSTPAVSLYTGPVNVGGYDTYAPAANVVYAIKVQSAASSNVATLTAATGDVVQTTGSPVITKAGENFEGVDLGVSTKIHGLRIRTSGSGTITLAGSSSGLFPAMVLQSGSDVVIKFPLAGATLAGSETIAATFSASAGILNIEALQQI